MKGLDKCFLLQGKEIHESITDFTVINKGLDAEHTKPVGSKQALEHACPLGIEKCIVPVDNGGSKWLTPPTLKSGSFVTVSSRIFQNEERTK